MVAVGGEAAGTGAERLRFDLAHLPLRKTFAVEEAKDGDIPHAIALAGKSFPQVEGQREAIWRVHRRSRSILVARGRQRVGQDGIGGDGIGQDGTGGDGIVGTAAFLRLNRDGLVRLRADALDVVDPDDALLARPGEDAAAIYAWLLCLPGAAVAAMGGVMRWLHRAGLDGCDLYARPGSPAGERFMRKTGFGPTDARLGGQRLWVYPQPSRTTPARMPARKD